MLTPSALLFVVAISVSAGVLEVVTAAQAAESELNYDRAVELWLDVLAEPALDEDIKMNAHVRLATLYRILGDEGEARSHFRWVLAKKPDFQLHPDAPRKVQAFFAMVKEELEASRPSPAPEPVVAAPAPAPAVSVEAPTPAPQRFGNPLTPLLFVGSGLSVAAGVGSGLLAAVSFAAGDGLQKRALEEDVQLARDAIYDERDGAYLVGNVAGLATIGCVAVAAALFAGGFVEAP